MNSRTQIAGCLRASAGFSVGHKLSNQNQVNRRIIFQTVGPAEGKSRAGAASEDRNTVGGTCDEGIKDGGSLSGDLLRRKAIWRRRPEQKLPLTGAGGSGGGREEAAPNSPSCPPISASVAHCKQRKATGHGTAMLRPIYARLPGHRAGWKRADLEGRRPQQGEVSARPCISLHRAQCPEYRPWALNTNANGKNGKKQY